MRLDFADWLQAHGDSARAGLIRAQIGGDGSAADAYEQGAASWAASLLTPLGLAVAGLRFEHHSNSWRCSAHSHVTVRLWDGARGAWAVVPELCYQRGFVSHLRLSLEPGQRLQEALGAEPIVELTLTLRSGQDLSLWSACTGPRIQGIRRLQLEFCEDESIDLSPLLADPNWGSLTDLHLSCWPSVPQLSAAPLLEEILQQLAGSSWSKQLKRLELWDVNWRALAALQLENWSLQHLRAWGNPESEETELSVLPSSLVSLDLQGLALGDEGLARLARQWLPELRQLVLTHAHIGAAGLAQLAATPLARNLESLLLLENGLQAKDIPGALRPIVDLERLC